MRSGAIRTAPKPSPLEGKVSRRVIAVTDEVENQSNCGLSGAPAPTSPLLLRPAVGADIIRPQFLLRIERDL